jgi:aryl-alcohol dehydrogenase-like predicted oxidoreductase
VSVTAIQTEYSLFSREAENHIIPICKELGIGLVACAPISRGLLSETMTPFINLLPDDFRSKFPRFEAENLAHNCEILSSLSKVAQSKSCSLPQLALAWVSTQSPSFIPLFGTTRSAHVQENIKSLGISLTQSEINSINEIVSKGVVQGSRHPDAGKQFYRAQ